MSHGIPYRLEYSYRAVEIHPADRVQTATNNKKKRNGHTHSKAGRACRGRNETRLVVDVVHQTKVWRFRFAVSTRRRFCLLAPSTRESMDGGGGVSSCMCCCTTTPFPEATIHCYCTQTTAVSYFVYVYDMHILEYHQPRGRAGSRQR